MSPSLKHLGRKPGSLVRCRCCVCGTVEMASGTSGYYRCVECRDQGRFAPTQNSRYNWVGKEQSGLLVARAIREGKLPHPRTLKCVDCGSDAIEYEHRDYNKPLDVEPICRGCNLRRGPAKPIDGSIRRVVQQGFTPYRLKIRAVQALSLIGVDASVLDGMPKKLTLSHWRQIVAAIPATPAPQETNGEVA